MLVKQGSTPELTVVCDIPTITAGVPAYAQPGSYEISVNGGAFAGGGGTLNGSSFPGGGTAGPWIASLTLGGADTATLGFVEILLLDGPSNVVGTLKIQVVAIDVLDGAHLGLSSIPNANPGASGGLLICGTNQGLTFNGVAIVGGGLNLIPTSGSGESGLTVRGDGTAPAIVIRGGATAPGVALHGGATSGAGMVVTTTIGDGIDVTPTAGHALHLAADGTNKNALLASGGTAGVSDGIKITAGTGGVDMNAGLTLSDPGIDAILDLVDGVETGFTVRQALRILAGALAGKISGAATTTVTIRNLDDTKNRIVATVDNNGNRTAVTYDVS